MSCSPHLLLEVRGLGSPGGGLEGQLLMQSRGRRSPESGGEVESTQNILTLLIPCLSSPLLHLSPRDFLDFIFQFSYAHFILLPHFQSFNTISYSASSIGNFYSYLSGAIVFSLRLTLEFFPFLLLPALSPCLCFLWVPFFNIDFGL